MMNHYGMEACPNPPEDIVNDVTRTRIRARQIMHLTHDRHKVVGPAEIILIHRLAEMIANYNDPEADDLAQLIREDADCWATPRELEDNDPPAALNDSTQLTDRLEGHRLRTMRGRLDALADEYEAEARRLRDEAAQPQLGEVARRLDLLGTTAFLRAYE